MPALRLAFAGTPDFAAVHLAGLINSSHELVAVLTQPDRPAGRGKKDRPSPVKVLAENHQIPVLQPQSLRNPQALAAIAELQLDALIVVAYGLILPQNVLDLPRYGCLNVHGSLLPRWRGAAPIQRAVEAGDKESGVTIMLMDAGLDTGPMLAHGPCAITAQTSSGDLYGQLATIGPGLLLQVLEDLPARLATATVQDDAQASYAAKISKEEALIDWAEPAAVIARRIRAFNPAPGCYSFLEGQRLKIWAAQSVEHGAERLPGEIIASDDSGISVCCGDGVILLKTLQMAGSRAMQASELLRGHSELFAPGKRFGTQVQP
ncbi:methionyl-tRNA formyltransferase [gamma proteobacterium NOR5-3]|nr:methionyl-tRNA formyltransferase [gamma proteobacterium NOR5-3]